MGLLGAPGLAPAAATHGKAPTAPPGKPTSSSSAPPVADGKPQSPQTQALVARIRDTMARIKTLEAASSPQAAA